MEENWTRRVDAPSNSFMVFLAYKIITTAAPNKLGIRDKVVVDFDGNVFKKLNEIYVTLNNVVY